MLDEERTKLLTADDGLHDFNVENKKFTSKTTWTTFNKHYGTIGAETTKQTDGCKLAQEYYCYPYTEEEKRQENKRQRRIVFSTVILCLVMMIGGLSQLIV